jgi:uncharacterized protein
MSSIAEWPRTVEQVAGWSAGDPYALACAAVLPHRVRAVATLAGMAPLELGRDGAHSAATPQTAKARSGIGGRDRNTQYRYRSNEHMAERDRDEFGRPRNARPRDALGRLLPPGSEGVPRIPDDLELSPSESLAYAQDLLNEGLAFNAHEVLEAAWKNGPDDERPLWQGLAQLAVGITHVQRGNRDGATTLLRRGSGRLGEVDHPAPHFVDVDGLVGWAAALVDDLAACAEVSPPRLRPALTKP